MQVEAHGPAEARQIVESAGHRLISARETTAFLGRELGWRKAGFNTAIFNQQLLALLESGQTVTDAIEILSRNDRARRHAYVYGSLTSALRQGKQLSVAMAQMPSAFSGLFVAMIAASETTGTVRATLRRYIAYQAQVDALRTKLRAAATYPGILSAVGLFVIGFLLLYVAPKFSTAFEDIATNRTGAASLIQAWGGFVQKYWLLAWGGFVLAIGLPIAAIMNPQFREFLAGRLLASRWVGERLYLMQLARLYRTLGMLIQSGLSVTNAMQLAESALPASLQPRIVTSRNLVSQGKSLSVAMNLNGLSNDVAQKLLVAGESSGRLPEMLDRIADFFEQETTIWLDQVTRVLEPMLMVVIGIVIGVVVALLYSPIFDLANAI